MLLSSRKYTLHYCLLPSMKYTKHGVHCRYMGGYIGTLLLMLKQDFPRIIGVFLVINFSFGGGLYFALVGQYGGRDVDMADGNSTRYSIQYIYIYIHVQFYGT